MSINSKRAAQINAIENGRGIQQLLNDAYEIMGSPILIHDMEYRAVAYSEGVVTDDPIWNEYAANGTVGYSRLDFFKNECFLEEAANAKKITFLTSDKLKYNRIFGKLFNKNNIQIGCAVMLECGKPFEEDEPQLFEMICDLISEELGRDEYYNKYGQAYFEKLIEELIAGVDDTALYAAHVESIYMHLKSNLYLAAVDVGECNSERTRIEELRDLCKKTQPEYAYAVYSGYILIIIGIDEETLDKEKDLRRLNRLFRERDICAGISNSFENLFELNKYFKQATAALGKKTEDSERHIFLSDKR